MRGWVGLEKPPLEEHHLNQRIVKGVVIGIEYYYICYLIGLFFKLHGSYNELELKPLSICLDGIWTSL